MRAEAAQGDVVIVGRAGNEALAGVPGALHVLVIAGQRQRIQRVMAAEGLDAFDALDRIKESDRRRAAYARQFYGQNWLDPLRYDLVVNTSRLSIEDAADVIVHAARRAAAAAAPPQPVAAVA
jgi:cytidylate kinase